jgi:hypothetical protein
VKRQQRNLLLFGSGAVLLTLALGTWMLHFKPKRALAAYREQLIAAGEKLEVAELIPPPVPSERNGADLFLKAQSWLNYKRDGIETNPPSAMPMIAPGKALVRWRQSEAVGGRFENTTISWPEIEAELASYNEVIGMLDQLASKQTIDFDLNYREGFGLLLPHLAKMRRATQLLSAATVTALHRGDTQLAQGHLLGMLALVRCSATERLAVSQLVRFALSDNTLDATWEYLQSPQATEAQLAELQSNWMEPDFVGAAEAALGMERAMTEMVMNDLRESSAEFHKLTGFGRGGGRGSAFSGNGFVEAVEDFAKNTWRGAREKSLEVAWRVAWSYPDQLRSLQGKQVLLESLRLARRNGHFAGVLETQNSRLAAFGFKNVEDDDRYGWLSEDLDLQNLFASSVESQAKVANKLLVAEAGRQLVVTAISLKRYQLRHGGFPATLSALVPEFLATVPLDPVVGVPLRYHVNADGTWQLYSVGKDNEDNGGDARPTKDGGKRSLTWQRGRDWVWPQPATDAEIAEYHSNRTNNP